MTKIAEPIAIVGTACRLPGGVNNTSELWELLMKGESGYSEFPKDRINIDAWYHPERVRPGSLAGRGGFFCKHDLHDLDNKFFGITGVEASAMDIAQKQILEVAYEAIESGGVSLNEIKGSETGVYAAYFGSDASNLKDIEYTSAYTSTGTGGTMMSNRISFAFDLKGPSCTFDTACASAFYALHFACHGLRNGDCSAAIVCAPSVIRDIESLLTISRLGALSQTSRCHTFDERADGYARGDAFCAIYIMPLSAALEKRLPVRGVIRASAIGANGNAPGLTYPDIEGQVATIRKCYSSAGLTDLHETAYFECHGTGTPAGDPVETEAVSLALCGSRTRYDPLLIGSIKPNLGHSEAASGLSALFKVMMAVEKGVIPPTIGLIKVNPAIKLDEWKLKIVTEQTAWPNTKSFRRASINSFGYGGANAHVLVESAVSVLEGYKTTLRSSLLSDSVTDGLKRESSEEDRKTDTTPSSPSDSGAFLLNLNKVAQNDTPKLVFYSAKSKLSLSSMAEKVQDVLMRGEISVEDVAYTLSRRSKFEHRAVAFADGAVTPTFLTGVTPVGISRLGYVFTGQGAQWPQMGKDLLKFASFRESIRLIDEALAGLPQAPPWTVEEMMTADLSPEEMDEPRVAQIVSVALEMAVADLLASWNVFPEMVAGHSAGEIAAAYCAGYLTRMEAVAVAYYRGDTISAASLPPGRMLAVGISAEEVKEFLPKDGTVIIGAINSPRSVTLTGNAPIIAAIQQTLDDRKIFNRLLSTKGVAYHSHHMPLVAEAYEKPLYAMGYTPPSTKVRAKFFSTVTGALWDDCELPLSYWGQNLESPVLFYPAVAEMRKAGMTHTVEIGPHGTLRSPILDIVKSLQPSYPEPFQYLGALKRKDDCIRTVLTVASNLYFGGLEVDVNTINGGRGAWIDGLPSYCWDHSSKYVTESRIDVEWRCRKYPRHDLLGSKFPGGPLSHICWRNVISIANVPWLLDHKVDEQCVFPAAGYLSMAVEAMRQTLSDDEIDPDSFNNGDRSTGAFVLKDVFFDAAMILDGDVETFFILRKQHLGHATISDRWWEFNVSSVKDGLSTDHAKGQISWDDYSVPFDQQLLPPSTLPFRESIPESLWYEEITHRKGLIFGTSFQRLLAIEFDARENRGRASLNLSIGEEMTRMAHESSYIIHPSALDGILQLAVIATGLNHPKDLHEANVPHSLRNLTLFPKQIAINMAATGSGGFANLDATARRIGFKAIYSDIELRDPATSQIIAAVEDLRFSSVRTIAPPSKKEPFWRVVWDDDYSSITAMNSDVYFPEERYRPIQSRYSRQRRSRFAQLAVLQFSQQYPELLSSEPINLENKFFIQWVHWLLVETKRDQPELYNLTVEERERELNEERRLFPEDTEWYWVIYTNLHRLINGEISALDIATENQLLAKFYASQVAYGKFARVVEILSFKYPGMRILEIGAGTGSATEYALNALTAGDTRRYRSYTYTDVSTSFFAHAAERFGQFKDIEYRAYDLRKSPEEQDYEPESFDLVIASNAIHVAPNITNALKEVRRLLKVGGKLLLSEITSEYHDQTFSLGLFPGFYNGHEEGRTRHPFWTTEQWETAFPKAGFKNELSLNDAAEEPGSTVFCASAVPLESFDDPSTGLSLEYSGVTIVHLGRPGGIADYLIEAAWEEGIAVHQRSLVYPGCEASSEWIGSKRIIVIAELERYIWPTITKEEWTEFLKMLRAADNFLWVTQGGLMDGEDPQASLINGFISCMDYSPTIRAATVDFDKSSPRDKHMARDILFREKLLRIDKDMQFRHSHGKWMVSRLVPDEHLNIDFNRDQRFGLSASDRNLEELGPIKVATTDPGRLSALVFRPDYSIGAAAPGPNEVRIEVKAAGMNMSELGALSGTYDINNTSSEVSGIITHIGSNVNDLYVGDRVFALHLGQYGNIIYSPASLCQKGRGNESFEQLATLPLSFCAAIHAIVTVGRVQPKEKILIQSATGGFGMAAIAIARRQRADIYATAGTGTKRQLLKEMGIPADHIFDSRSATIYKDMKSATGGRGFDVVINTSTGEYFRDVSLRLLASMGRFLQVVNQDIRDQGIMNLDVFKEGGQFFPLDMRYIYENNLGIISELLQTVGNLYRSGKIDALPLNSYPISKISEAYTEFSRFQHTGKLVLSYPPDCRISYLDEPKPIHFPPDAAYLIVGGLRGIGGHLGRWMARCGAKHLILLGRSSASKEDAEIQETILYLQQAGTKVYPVQGNVCSRHDVQRALTISGLPVRGVVNSAMFLRNMNLFQLTPDDIHECFRPKVEGNITLYETIQELGIQLDFYVMLGSVTSISRYGSQAAYSAANCFTDEYARYLRRRGTPATSILLGAIGGAGFAWRNNSATHLLRNGYYSLSIYELIQQFSIALFRPQPDNDPFWENPIVLVDPAKFAKLLETVNGPNDIWDRDARWRIIATHVSKQNNQLNSRFEEAKSGAGILDLVIERLAKLLWLPVEDIQPDRYLTALGIDSMIASEFRHWMYQTFRKNVSVIELLAADMTPEKLASILGA